MKRRERKSKKARVKAMHEQAIAGLGGRFRKARAQRYL